MNVRLHHERIVTDFFDGLGLQLVAVADDGKVDLLDRLGVNQAEGFANRLVIKGCLIAIPQSHDGSQLAMIFRQIRQLVISQMATQSNGHQNTDVPVLHSLATGVGSSSFADIVAVSLKNLVGQLSVTINMLQRFENRNDVVRQLDFSSTFSTGTLSSRS